MSSAGRQTESFEVVALPPPAREPGILSALSLRRTIREISPAGLSPQLLSDLLWAAYGVNRRLDGPFGGQGRTAASASNSQEIDLYVAMPEAIYLYEAQKQQLLRVARGDFRSATLTPGQKQVTASAPVQLIYVVDLNRLTHTTGFDEPGLHDPEIQKSYYFVDTGLIAGNVYLFAAAHGLAAWFHNCDRKVLARALRLTYEQRVLFAQSVGYPDVP